MLIVVTSEDRSLYDHLARAMTEVAGVHVMADRRLGQRRGVAGPVSGERRQSDRRQPRGVIQSIGCTFVRFHPAHAL